MNASTDRLLRRTLWGNAVFSVVSGAVLAAFAGPFARIAAHGPVALMGLDLAIVFELLGIGRPGLDTAPAAYPRLRMPPKRPQVLGWT